MKAAKPVKTRIGEPREKDRKATKPANFTVADTPIASRRDKRGEKGAISFSKAAFALSVHDPRDLPRPGLPEIAFVGRSNAGKSSAINTLANRRRLAFASKTPGRTQLINFFTLGSEAYLVDLPGYGYAGVPGAVKEHWKTLVGRYLGERESLALVIVVMDARHPLTALDRELLDWLGTAGRKAHVLLTKSDKLSRQAATATLARVRRELARDYPGGSAQLFSSLKHEGVPEVAQAVAASLRTFGAEKTRAPAKGE